VGSGVLLLSFFFFSQCRWDGECTGGEKWGAVAHRARASRTQTANQISESTVVGWFVRLFNALSLVPKYFFKLLTFSSHQNFSIHKLLTFSLHRFNFNQTFNFDNTQPK
jgi:hypothetical protein